MISKFFDFLFGFERYFRNMPGKKYYKMDRLIGMSFSSFFCFFLVFCDLFGFSFSFCRDHFLSFVFPFVFFGILFPVSVSFLLSFFSFSVFFLARGFFHGF